MIFFIIFLLLCIVELCIVWLKWDSVSKYVSIGTIASKALGVEEKYTGLINKVVIFFVKHKNKVWIPIMLICLANIMAAALVVSVIKLIETICNFFSF
jgi:hypothetical protein